MSRVPWLRMRKKTAPEPVEHPPIRLGAFSNGEYFHEQTPLERKIEREILAQASDKARRLGMERREFLASAMGMATSLSVLNLAGTSGSERSGTPAAPDGGYHIPPEATMDCALAEAIVNGQNEFIFDIQTHHIDNEGSWRTTNPTSGATLATLFSKYNGCTDADLTRCIDADTYLQQVFWRATRPSRCSRACPRPCAPKSEPCAVALRSTTTRSRSRSNGSTCSRAVSA